MPDNNSVPPHVTSFDDTIDHNVSRSRKRLTGVESPVAHRIASQGTTVRGKLERIVGSYAQGWVLSERNPLHRLVVEIWADDTIVASGPASSLPEDLRDDEIGDDRFMFSISLPSQLSNGRYYVITAKVRDTDYTLAGTLSYQAVLDISVPGAQPKTSEDKQGYIESVVLSEKDNRLLISGWLMLEHIDNTMLYPVFIGNRLLPMCGDRIFFERPDLGKLGLGFAMIYDDVPIALLRSQSFEAGSTRMKVGEVEVGEASTFSTISADELTARIGSYIDVRLLEEHPDIAAMFSFVPNTDLANATLDREIKLDWHNADDAFAPLGHRMKSGLRLSPIPQTTTEPIRAIRGADLSGHPTASEVVDRNLAVVANALDEAFYRAQLPLDYPRDGSLESLAQHYDTAGWKAGLDPYPAFSTRGYLTQNEDIRRAGVNPLLHYLLQGMGEGRRSQSSNQKANGRTEWRGYNDVRERGSTSLEGDSPDHASVDFVVSLLGRDLGKTIKAASFEMESTDTAEAGPIKVSIIVPCFDFERFTAECLVSISRALPSIFAIEVIIADNGSQDPLYEVLAKHPGLRCLQLGGNLGFGPACNAAAEIAAGEYLFFLNNDAQIAPDCLEVLVAGLEDTERGARPGIVGPKILNMNGTLQEAGCCLSPDGTGFLVGYGKDPLTPRYNYARTVEHVSGAAIMLRRDLFQSLGGFDPVYAPAYCEDADLSLKVRRQGLEIRYLPDAVVAHHLSKTSDGTPRTGRGNSAARGNQTKKQRIAKNRNTFVQRWSSELGEHGLRTIAFYLPQYHPVPQNDLWWGKGFTDWTNLTKAQRNFVGHNQPRFPADLGYYDLRAPEVMEAQAALARRYGVTGFCYYYYSFDGERVLEQPIERMLASGRPDLPFCLCWANENWTRRWDGKEHDILLGQSYSDEHAMEIAEDLTRYFASGSYIRVNGKPLILIYRVKEIGNIRRLLSIWRNVCRTVGIGEICIAAVESFELSAKPQDPRRFGCDLTVEFPAHGMVHDPAIKVEKVNQEWSGSVHDYRELATAFMRRVEAGFPRLRSVLVGWDSTPRHQNRSLVLDHATPGAFQAWLEWTYRRTIEQNFGDERIVFINAWNEWCEGSYLEPDQEFGHGYLQAVSNALDTVANDGADFVL